MLKIVEDRAYVHGFTVIVYIMLNRVDLGTLIVKVVYGFAYIRSEARDCTWKYLLLVQNTIISAVILK